MSFKTPKTFPYFFKTANLSVSLSFPSSPLQNPTRKQNLRRWLIAFILHGLMFPSKDSPVIPFAEVVNGKMKQNHKSSLDM